MLDARAAIHRGIHQGFFHENSSLQLAETLKKTRFQIPVEKKNATAGKF
jgi:hypothetical protein